jgi:hypothetical protein
MENLDKYSISVNQIGMFNFCVEIISPDGLKFTNPTLQFDPNQLTKENLISNLIDKRTRNNWILDIGGELITEKQKKEIKLIPAEIKIEETKNE